MVAGKRQEIRSFANKTGLDHESAQGEQDTVNGLRERFGQGR